MVGDGKHRVRRPLRGRTVMPDPIRGGMALTGAVIGYLGVLAAVLALEGAVSGYGRWFWIGAAGAVAFYSAAFVAVLIPPPDGFSRRSAAAAAVLAVAAQAATWGAAVAGEPSEVGGYEPLIATAYVIYSMIAFRNHLAVAWCGAAVGLTVTLLLGPLTGVEGWWTGLQSTILAVLIVVSVACLALMPLLGEIDTLTIRYRRVAEGRSSGATPLPQRGERLEEIDQRVRPVLEGVVKRGIVVDDDVVTARLIEARLRDGIRAPAFDTEPMRDAVWRARARGVTVTLLDDGGLRALPEADTVAFLSALLPLLIAELDALSEGELIARVAPPGRSPLAMVTVAWRGTRRRVEFGPDGYVARVVRA